MGKQRKRTAPQNTPLPVPPAVPPPAPPAPPAPPEPPEPTDEQLIAAVAAGDNAAMNVLIERYHERVCRYLLSRGLQPEDVEDAVQNVFVNVFVRAHQYHPQPDSTFVNWLMGIAHNAGEDVRRQNNRRAAQSLDDEVGEFVENPGARAPIAFVLRNELAEITEAGLSEAVTPAQRYVLEVEYDLKPAHPVHVSQHSWATQYTRGLENLGEYIARHWYKERLPELEAMDDRSRLAVYREIGRTGMEALRQERLGAESDDTPREES